MKFAMFAGAALAIAGIGLSACSQETSEPVEASPDGFPGITVENARLALPAVKGNPGAVYFDVTYDGDATAMIRGVHVAGAESAMMHATVKAQGRTYMEELLQVKLEKGQTVKFEPGGNHVMAMGLDESLAVGGTTEVTLTFLGGDKTSFDAAIVAAGDAKAGMGDAN